MFLKKLFYVVWIQNLMIEISQYKYFKLWIQQYLHKPVKGIFILFYNLIFCKPSKLQRLKYLIFDIKRFCRESNYVLLWRVRSGLATFNNWYYYFWPVYCIIKIPAKLLQKFLSKPFFTPFLFFMSNFGGLLKALYPAYCHPFLGL